MRMMVADGLTNVDGKDHHLFRRDELDSDFLWFDQLPNPMPFDFDVFRTVVELEFLREGDRPLIIASEKHWSILLLKSQFGVGLSLDW